jgi:hypothetical protein
MSKRKVNPRARIAIRGLNDYHPGRPVPELRPCFPRVQADDHCDFTLRLGQQVLLAKRVLSIDLLPRRVQNCVGLGRAQPALNKRPDTPSMRLPADHRPWREKLSRCR